jgi:tyrosyl-tRNA synthetase
MDKGKIFLFDIISESGLSDSKSQAKRLIEQGAVEIDGKKIKDPTQEVEVTKDGFIIRVGKARFAKITAK